MTEQEIHELRKLMKELSEMQNIIATVADKIYDIRMIIWPKIMDEGQN